MFGLLAMYYNLSRYIEIQGFKSAAEDAGLVMKKKKNTIVREQFGVFIQYVECRGTCLVMSNNEYLLW
jgi:hypothetical protein